ncbi:UNVERIFIED_CONTAM: hypothetical protein GTU68_016820 [Idotea baltica]|nr:hypothetical protein [Idotea baltica]
MNTAIYLKRLLDDKSQVSYVTVVGQDTLSERLVRRLDNEALNTECIQRSDSRLVGLYAITTDTEGERTFSYWRSESAARTLFQTDQAFDFSVLAGFNVIYFSAISLAILPNEVRRAWLAELARLRETNNVTVAFDSNYRPALWESVETAQEVIASAWRITDIALPSVDDEQALFNDEDEAAVLARLRGYGISSGALKRGVIGPLSLSSDDSDSAATQQFASASMVVDTTAAGDSFNAGYLSAVLSGKDAASALKAGHECALRVIAHRGAIIPKHEW